MKIEYRVRPVTRYVVTRFHQDDDHGVGGEGKGEFDREETAYEVAYALCKDEHQRLGYPLADERIRYPELASAREARLVGEGHLTVADAITALHALSPTARLITERSLSDQNSVRITPQNSGAVLIF